jgi:hypothetical protein
MRQRRHTRDLGSWSFQDIESACPERAAALKAAGSPDQLIAALCAALKSGFDRKDVRLGFERAKERRENRRAVVQFALGEKLFDWMFNARTGYRAQFRVHIANGLGFNDRIVESLVAVLDDRLPDPVPCVDLSEEFDHCGLISVERRRFLASLTTERSLTKVWFCVCRIGNTGGIELLAPGLAGSSRKLFVGDKEWAAPFPDDDNAWLDLKGAFLGEDEPYQPKHPVCRARELASCGKA